jgi:hypothetical protein
MKLSAVIFAALSTVTVAQNGYWDVPSPGFRLIVRSSNSTYNGCVPTPRVLCPQLTYKQALPSEPATKELRSKVSALPARHSRIHRALTPPSTTTSAPPGTKLREPPMPMALSVGSFELVAI